MAEADIQGPLVFSCLNCRTIVGDSFSLVCTNADLKSVTISQASSIARLEDLITSKEGIDRGSTYFSITCRPCNSYLGRFYITTPKALDDLRECFTFMVDNISSYELGKGEFGVRQPVENTKNGDDDNNNNNKDGEDEEFDKLKHVLLDVSQRLVRLEEREIQRSLYERGGSENHEDLEAQPTQAQYQPQQPEHTPTNQHPATIKTAEKQPYPFHASSTSYDDHTINNAAITPTYKRMKV